MLLLNIVGYLFSAVLFIVQLINFNDWIGWPTYIGLFLVMCIFQVFGTLGVLVSLAASIYLLYISVVYGGWAYTILMGVLGYVALLMTRAR